MYRIIGINKRDNMIKKWICEKIQFNQNSLGIEKWVELLMINTISIYSDYSVFYTLDNTAICSYIWEHLWIYFPNGQIFKLI